MNPDKNPSAQASTREITAMRIFDAPRELVFDAWTDPVHISRWWGPMGFTTTTSRMDARTGGVWEHVMHGPDGTDYKNKIVYVEVTRSERIIYDHLNAPLFRSTTIFEAVGKKTRIQVTLVFGSAELRERVVREHGAEDGLVQMLVRLGEHLSGGGRSPVPADRAVGGKEARQGPSPDELTLVRTFGAPRDLVFKAWIDPVLLTRWWGPEGFTTTMRKWEPHAGGGILFEMNAPYGAVYPMGGNFVEIVPSEKIVFRNAALDPEARAIMEILNTVTFADDSGKTKLTLHTRVLSRRPEADQYLKGQKAGWTQSLDRLGALVSRGGR